MARFIFRVLAFFLLLQSSLAFAGKTFDAIKARGYIKCGVVAGVPGFSVADSKGQQQGLSVDFCRALSAAIFNDPKKVEFISLAPSQRFLALQSGEVDLLSSTVTWTLTRDASLGLLFAGVYFYDGQGFLVPKKLGIKNLRGLNGAEICVLSGTTTELNLADYSRSTNVKFKQVVFDNVGASLSALEKGRCQALTNDRSSLAGLRLEMAKQDDYVLLPEIISKEPLGPVVRRGDDEWFTIVKWMLYALFDADEKGVTSKNVDSMKSSADPDIQRLLGVSGNMGEKLGLQNDWAYNAIKMLGNYDEMYQRHIAPLGIKREGTPNASWMHGGLMYGMPIR